MNKQHYERINETLVHERLPNGLDVYILEKPGFQKTYATFSTKYGSIDNHFQIGDQQAIQVPDGIAHFLEHKMFEEPEGDIFASFATNGASANAFTSFDRTVYLFSSTQHVRENLMTLIDFVQRPYFTDENVEKEKGIIGQEINMYRDNADWRAYFGLIEAMYQQHPVHIDIAGTVDSIAQITKETLYDCYRTFYHPSNMHVFVVGGVNAEETLEWIRQNQAAKSFEPQGEIRRWFPEEPEQVHEPRREVHLPVALPKCLFGFKEPASGISGKALLKQELTMKILLDLMFSPSSELYEQLYEAQLITDNFGFEVNLYPDFHFTVLGGDTPNPDGLLEAVKTAVERMKQDGIDPIRFERSRKKRIGATLRQMNSPEAISNEFTKYLFRGMDLFDTLTIYDTITLEDAAERLKQHMNWERLAVSIVRSGE